MFETNLASYLSRASGEHWQYTGEYDGHICGRFVSLKQADAIRVVKLYAELRKIVMAVESRELKDFAENLDAEIASEVQELSEQVR